MKTLLLLLFTATAAHAQYTIAWSTMDGGGGSGTTGGYTLNATLGQPDIAAGIAGNFTFTGGYWSHDGDALPVLRIFLSAQNITLAWPNPSPGFELQTSPALLPPAWATVAAVPAIVGAEKQVTWGPANGARFFRLQRP